MSSQSQFYLGHDQELVTRRHFFSRCAMGLGGIALASLLSENRLLGAAPGASSNPMAPRLHHFRPRVKNIIYLFMAGGPSQLDLFDYKPKLVELNGQPIPQSFIEGKRFAFMGSSHGTNLLGTRRQFRQRGQSGAWVSELFPHTATIVDEIALVHSCATNLFNHAPAKLFMNTGSGQFGRPSMGAWVAYGIGSECDNLPGFVVLLSGPRGPRGGAVNWGSGFLPTSFQGVPFRSGAEPILDLSNPPDVSAERQRRTIDAIRDLNLKRAVETGDPLVCGDQFAVRFAFDRTHLPTGKRETAVKISLYTVAGDVIVREEVYYHTPPHTPGHGQDQPG